MTAPSSSAYPRFLEMLSEMLRRARASVRSLARAVRCVSRLEKSGVDDDSMTGWRDGDRYECVR